MNISKSKFLLMLVFALTFGFLFPVASYAASNVTSTTTYAWGDVLGWVNFGPANGNVTVTNITITGYAWSTNYGWINLAPTNGGVINDGQGNLSGKAWGQNTGWIDFTGVSINSSGKFTGHTASSTQAGDKKGARAARHSSPHPSCARSVHAPSGVKANQQIRVLDRNPTEK
jgi:hypothetical protein